MTSIEAVNNFLNNNPKTAMVLLNAIIAVILIFCKHYFDKYINTKETINSAKILLTSFSNILISAIMNNNKDIAKEHYIILLNSSIIFKNDIHLYSIFNDLQQLYIYLQLDNFVNESNDVFSKDIAIKKIETLKKSLQT